jgi:hypothetical protein
MQIVGRHQRLPAEVGLVRGRQMDAGVHVMLFSEWPIVTGEPTENSQTPDSIPKT